MNKNEIARGIVKKMTKDEQVEFLKTDILPPIKLSQKEMNFIKGGGLSLVNLVAEKDMKFD